MKPRMKRDAKSPESSLKKVSELYAAVHEPAKPKTWPNGFFDSIHVTDAAFERPEQGQLPPIKNL